MDHEADLNNFGLNRVLLTPETAVLLAFSKGDVGMDRILPDPVSLYGIELVPEAPLFFNGEVRGSIRTIRYDRMHHGVVIYARHSLSLDLAPYLVGRADLIVDQIGCSRCLGYFSPEDTPCYCLESSDPLLVRKIAVQSVRFWDARNEKATVADARDGLLRSYFRSPMSYLEVLDPI